MSGNTEDLRSVRLHYERTDFPRGVAQLAIREEGGDQIVRHRFTFSQDGREKTAEEMKTFAVCFALMCVVVAFSSAYPSPKRGSKVPPILQGYVGFIDIIPTKEDPNLENEVEIYRPSSFIMEDIILPEKVSGKAAPNMPGGRIIDFE